VHDDACSRWSWFAVEFHKKELIPGVQGANCQVLNSSHDIHKDSASSWSAAARRAWILCEGERIFWVGQLGVADPWWWCKVLNMWFWILSKDFRIPVMWSQGSYSSILRVTTTTRGWICFCSQLMIAACESEEML
jgi:hypothetical protein